MMVAGDEKPVHTAKPTGNTYRVPAKLKPDTEYFWVVNSGINEVGNGSANVLYDLGSLVLRRGASTRTQEQKRNEVFHFCTWVSTSSKNTVSCSVVIGLPTECAAN